MTQNSLAIVPRTYLGLGKLIESLRATPGWTSVPDHGRIELLVAIRYLQLDSLDSLKKFESNDYLRRAMGRRSDSPYGFQNWIASPQYQVALSALRALLATAATGEKIEFSECSGEGPVRILINGHPIEKASVAYTDWIASSQPVSFLPGLDRLTIDVLNAIQLRSIGRHCSLPEFRLGHCAFFDESEIGQLETQGYFVREGFCSPVQTARLREIVYELAAKEASEGRAYFYGNEGRLQRVYNLLDKSPAFSEHFLEQAAIFELLQRFFGGKGPHTPYFLSSFQANILNPGANAQALHVDSSVPDPLPPWKIRLNINLLLDPFTETNGATLVYPGSHMFLRKPTQHDDVRQRMHKLIAPAGSLVVWTGHLWHQSGANKDTRPRSALLACFVASYLREVAVEENYLEVMDRNRLESLPFEVKALLGYYHGRKEPA